MPKKKKKDDSIHDSNKPWVSNYPPLQAWLDKYEARCMWQVPSEARPDDGDLDWAPGSYIECWLVNRRPVVIVVRGNKGGWDLFTSHDTNQIAETLADAERRLSITKE